MSNEKSTLSSKPEWDKVEDKVRSAWQEKPESSPLTKKQWLSSWLIPKEVRVKPSQWIRRGMIVILLILVIVEIVLFVQWRPSVTEQAPTQYYVGPPVMLLPTPAIATPSFVEEHPLSEFIADEPLPGPEPLKRFTEEE